MGFSNFDSGKKDSDIEIAQCFNKSWDLVISESGRSFDVVDFGTLRKRACDYCVKMLVDLRQLKSELSGVKGKLPEIPPTSECITRTKEYNLSLLNGKGGV